MTHTEIVWTLVLCALSLLTLTGSAFAWGFRWRSKARSLLAVLAVAEQRLAERKTSLHSIRRDRDLMANRATELNGQLQKARQQAARLWAEVAFLHNCVPGAVDAWSLLSEVNKQAWKTKGWHWVESNR